MARIVVNPADEDAVVAVGPQETAMSFGKPQDEMHRAAKPASDALDTSHPETVPVDDAPPAGEPPSPASVSKTPGARPSTATARSEDRSGPVATYGETTLEDLESSRMPFIQKAIIVAAVVCIIGALVYYFAAMR